MSFSRLRRLAAACRPVFQSFALIAGLAAQVSAAGASLNGRVLDQLGEPVSGAKITLVRDGQRVSDVTSNPRGEFSFDGLAEGRYRVEAIAAGFEPRTSDAVFVSAGGRATLDVALQIGTVVQHVLVTAAADEVPQAQVGASVTVLDAALIDALGNTDLLEPLRTVPGAAVVPGAPAMNRKILFQVAAPAIVIGLLLVGTCLVSA